MESYSINQTVVGTGFYYKQLSGAENERKPSGTPSSSSEHVWLDPVTLSREGQEQSSHTGSSQLTREDVSTQKDNTERIDQQEIGQLLKLKQRDTEVRAHEQAHLSAAGRFARGGASFTLQKGPDGTSYAIGGEVGIDVGKESTPEATIVKMQTIRRAALAPANPSAADRRIASQASVKEAQARQELVNKTQEELLQADISVDFEVDGAQRPAWAGSRKQSEPSFSSAALKSAIAAYQKVAES